MQLTETKLKGCYIIEPKVFKDSRGYFFESFNQAVFSKETGIDRPFVQDNQSYSKYGVIRGLHYQKPPFQQAKLVRVVQGRVLDVAVDIRPDSPTFGEHITVQLSAENMKQCYIPRGFAHGFSVLSESAIFAYKCDNYYHKESEAGILYNDPNLAIDWGLPQNDIIVSDKDRELLELKKVLSNN